jgi:hypothetical protein
VLLYFLLSVALYSPVQLYNTLCWSAQLCAALLCTAPLGFHLLYFFFLPLLPCSVSCPVLLYFLLSTASFNLSFSFFIIVANRREHRNHKTGPRKDSKSSSVYSEVVPSIQLWLGPQMWSFFPRRELKMSSVSRKSDFHVLDHCAASSDL